MRARRSEAEIEAQVLAVRDAHPAWGARKIERWLTAGLATPAASTVHEILRRHGRIDPLGSVSRSGPRFEKEAPNLLWQMDFKGWMTLASGAAAIR